MRSSIKKQSASVVRAFVRSQIVMLEMVTLGVALYFIQQKSANAQTTIAILLFCVFVFTLVTGKGFPHFRHRGKALLFLAVTGFFAVQGATIVEQQQEAYLAELRASDPTAYLTELHEIDEERWFEELRELDPDAHAAEADRRAVLAEAERLAQCTDQKASEAYVMIQADVRRGLLAPSTAEFPGRYKAGTRHIGDCVYQVLGHFDAQNGFGAMLRGQFNGTIEYFPERGSWRTLTLDVQG